MERDPILFGEPRRFQEAGAGIQHGIDLGMIKAADDQLSATANE